MINRIQEAGGGRERIQYDYGRLMFVTGEAALFVNVRRAGRTGASSGGAS